MYETLGKLILLAGPENAPFYIRAGDKFASRQAWPPAAALYFRAVKHHEASGSAPPELVFAFHEAMYKSADQPDIPPVFASAEMARVDEPISLIARSRNAFYSRNIDQAYVLLNRVKKLDPKIPEVILLEAEFNSLEGKSEQARQLATSLASDLTVPTWIRIFAEEIIKRLP